MIQGPDPDFEALLAFLRRENGFDFRGYKRASLRRRVQRRLDHLGIKTYTAYRDYLKAHAGELTELLNTILINVTAFMRDREAWAHLAGEALPALIAQKPPDSPIRVWSAGCASGEEALSAAIVLAELLGVEGFLSRVKVYATDVDEDALAHARSGYTAREVASLAPGLLTAYFDHRGPLYTFRADLRRALIFGRLDLVRDAPISRIDLVICRNTLMYFDSSTQRRVLQRLHCSLNPGGLLFLGKAELMTSLGTMFRAENLKYRVFTRVEGEVPDWRVPHDGPQRQNQRQVKRRARIRDAVQDSLPVPQITVDRNGDVVLANAEAMALFAIKPESIGRPLVDLQVTYRPVELRSRIEEAVEQRRPVEAPGVATRGPTGETMLLRVRVDPLIAEDGEVLGCKVVFTDDTRHLELEHDLERSRAALAAAYEELRSVNEELQATNEELQSTVEELETTNRELESTNTELQTMNDDLQRSGSSFESFRKIAETVFKGLDLAVIAVDAEFKVRSWNGRAEELWGVTAAEVTGQPLLGLDIGLPTRELIDPIRECLSKGTPLRDRVVEAVNRRGRSIRCRVTGLPVVAAGKREGVALLVGELSSARKPRTKA